MSSVGSPLLDDMLGDRPGCLIVPERHIAGRNHIRDLAGRRTITWVSVPLVGQDIAVPPTVGHVTPRFSNNYLGDSAVDPMMAVGTGDFAFEWWMVCVSSLGTYVQVGGRDLATGAGPLVYLTPTTGRLLCYAGGGNVQGTSNVADGQLHYCVYQRRSGQVQVWVDGRMENSASLAGSVVNNGLRWGTADGSYNWFHGWTGVLATYAKALGDGDIVRRFQLGRGLWRPAGRSHLLVA